MMIYLFLTLICPLITFSHFSSQTFRYQVLADTREDANKQLTAEWSLNIGESALDIACVSHSSSEVEILVLGEHNLFCLRDHGTLKFMRRFEFHPRCFHSYRTGLFSSFIYFLW